MPLACTSFGHHCHRGDLPGPEKCARNPGRWFLSEAALADVTGPGTEPRRPDSARHPVATDLQPGPKARLALGPILLGRTEVGQMGDEAFVAGKRSDHAKQGGPDSQASLWAGTVLAGLGLFSRELCAQRPGRQPGSSFIYCGSLSSAPGTARSSWEG